MTVLIKRAEPKLETIMFCKCDTFLEKVPSLSSQFRQKPA